MFTLFGYVLIVVFGVLFRLVFSLYGRILFIVLLGLLAIVFEHLLAYKCPETLGNKGLSGTLRFDENATATLLQHIV